MTPSLRRFPWLSLVLLGTGCGVVPGAFVSGAVLDDLPVDTVDPVSADAPPVAGDEDPVSADVAPQDEGVPADDVVELSDRVDFHGWSCLRDGPSTWDAADPCSDGTCDYVVLQMTCSLLGGAKDRFCLARAEDGSWDDCEIVWGARHGLSAEDVMDGDTGILAWIFTDAGLPSQGQQQLSPSAPLVKIAACADIDFDAPSAYELSPEGLVMDLVGLPHVACASDDTPGMWGGGSAVGGVRVPVDADCLGTEGGPGWELVRDPAGAYVRPLGFVVEEVGSGFIADLPAPGAL